MVRLLRRNFRRTVRLIWFEAAASARAGFVADDTVQTWTLLLRSRPAASGCIATSETSVGDTQDHEKERSLLIEAFRFDTTRRDGHDVGVRADLGR